MDIFIIVSLIVIAFLIMIYIYLSIKTKSFKLNYRKKNITTANNKIIFIYITIGVVLIVILYISVIKLFEELNYIKDIDDSDINKIRTTSISILEPIANYTCNDNYTLENDKCFIMLYEAPTIKWSDCETGWNEVNNYYCSKTSYLEPIQTWYTCPNDYYMKDDQCISNQVYSFNASCVTNIITGMPFCSCSGYPDNVVITSEYYGISKCTYRLKADKVENHICSNLGLYVEGKGCFYSESKLREYYFYCSEGYSKRSDDICEKKEYIDAIVSYSCEEGYELNDDNKCYRVIE